MHLHRKDPLASAITLLADAINRAANLATKDDLKQMEDRIIKALGERVDPKALEQLMKSVGLLEKAVAANQPKKLSGQ